MVLCLEIPSSAVNTFAIMGKQARRGALFFCLEVHLSERDGVVTGGPLFEEGSCSVITTQCLVRRLLRRATSLRLKVYSLIDDTSRDAFAFILSDPCVETDISLLRCMSSKTKSKETAGKGELPLLGGVFDDVDVGLKTPEKPGQESDSDQGQWKDSDAGLDDADSVPDPPSSPSPSPPRKKLRKAVPALPDNLADAEDDGDLKIAFHTKASKQVGLRALEVALSSRSICKVCHTAIPKDTLR